MIRLSLLALLAGCASLPAPTAQLRVTEHGAHVDAGLMAPDAEVRGCIVSIVGELPAWPLGVIYSGERCQVVWRPTGADADRTRPSGALSAGRTLSPGLRLCY